MKTLLTILSLVSFLTFSQNYVQNEVLVQLKPKVNYSLFFRQFESNNNLQMVNIDYISKPMNIYKVKYTSISSHTELIKLLKNNKNVITAQLNHFVTERETIPNDTLFTNNQWHLKNTGQTGGTIDADIDATDAWDITTGGITTHNDTIVVCILEGGGVDINHIDLKDNIWKNYAEIPNNGIDDDNNGYIDDYLGWNIVNDNDVISAGSHGTRVAGMIGAKGNNITGISGVSQNVKMMIVQGQQASNEASVIKAYTYPLELRKKYNQTNGQLGAFVVATNASWGINNGDPANSPLWCALYDSLGAVGILNMGATSNSNVNVDVVGDLPTTCPSDYLIGITMTNSNDIRANSGYGPINIDLAAPGQGVYLTYPNNLYNSTSGTSFATPCVVGSAALLYATPCADFINFSKSYPDSAALKIRELLLNEVDPIVSLANDVASGGRLNINNSMNALLSSCNTNSCIAPYGLNYNNLSDTAIDINWNGFSTNYLLYIKEGNNLMSEIPLSVTQFNFDTLKPCTNYTIYIKAICGLDTSIASYPINFKTDGCCINPNLVATNIQNQSIEISWNSVLYATDYTLRYREIGNSNWTTVTNAVTNTVYTPLLSCTEYEFQIKTICTDSTHGFSNSYIFKTKGCGACYDQTYCSVSGLNSNTEWIDTIIIGNKSVGTGNNGGWLIYNNVEFSFLPGSSNIISIIPGYSGTNYTEKFSVWIDINQDGIFDSNEKVIGLLSNNGPVTGLFSIPSTALTGITKMRIGMISSATLSPTACNNVSVYGEYEDYCIYIGADAKITENKTEIKIYPNPALNYLNIKSNNDIKSITIKSIDGKTVMFSENGNNLINIEQLIVGVYIIQIETNEIITTLKFIKQ